MTTKNGNGNGTNNGNDGEMLPMTLAVIPSSSNPNVTYKVIKGADHNVYCTCPAWRFQKGVSPKNRTCKHLRALAANMKQHA